MLIAPLIPLWGVLAFVGLQRFAGSRWEPLFLVVIGGSFAVLFGYVARQVVSARRLRRATRKLGE